MQALVELALAATEEERTTGVSELVRKALTQHREEQQEAASNEIVSLLRRIEKDKQTQRREIRRLKAQLKRTKGNLDDLDRRWAYAQKTNNFLPVLRYFDMVRSYDLANPEDFDSLTSVPSDFEPDADSES